MGMCYQFASGWAGTKPALGGPWQSLRLMLLGLLGMVPGGALWCAEPAHWSVVERADRGELDLILNGRPFTAYRYRDPVITRPYFANVVAPSNVKITRNHPQAADDYQDHDTYHPGMWLAFGDLSGADSWRMRAPVDHLSFVHAPHAEGGILRFSVENAYWTADRQQQVCREVCRYTFHEVPNGVLVDWDCTFQSDDTPFAFGDQEELGVGVRLANAIAVSRQLGGRILNSNGQVNEKEAWGTQADWCDYSGSIGRQFVGIMLMPHPDNIRRSWCHVRNSGFMAMNPFGINAFTKQPKQEAVVPAGTPFRLRYGVLFHWHDRPADFDPAAAYQTSLKLMAANAR